MEKMFPSPADKNLACFQPSPFEGLERIEDIVSTATRVIQKAIHSYKDAHSYYNRGGWEQKKDQRTTEAATITKDLVAILERTEDSLENTNTEELRDCIAELREKLDTTACVGTLDCINVIKALEIILKHIDVKTSLNAESSGDEPSVDMPQDEEFEDDSKVA